MVQVDHQTALKQLYFEAPLFFNYPIIHMVRKPEGQRPLRKSSWRWENKVGMDIRERGWENVNWMMHMAQDRD
jgi:hypothetical protein